MRRFAGAWPKVDIELRESHSDNVLADLVERGELDLSFVQLPLDNPSLETVARARRTTTSSSLPGTRASPPPAGSRRSARSPSSR